MSYNIISFLKSATANRGAVPVADDNPLPVVLSAAAGSGAGVQTSGRIQSAATTNPTSQKAAPGVVTAIILGNSGTTAFFKLYNKASAPTVGTDVPVATYLIPATTGAIQIIFPGGKAFSLGIAWAITGVGSDADATAVALNQITGSIEYA